MQQSATQRAASGEAPVIVPLEPRHWPGVAELYRRFFGAWSQRRFADRHRWQFSANPYATRREPVILVGELGERVAGLFSMFPLPLRTPAGTILVGCTGDLVVAREYPMLPLALIKTMQKHPDQFASGMSAEAEKLGRMMGETLIPLSLTAFRFPLRNAGSTRRALRRNLPRWLRPAATPLVARILARCAPPRGSLRPRRPPPLPHEPRLVRLTGFGAGYAELWTTFAARFDYTVDRTPEYMQWRYLDGPATSLEIWGLQETDGSLGGLLVIGERFELADDRTPCGTSGEILELILRDPADTGALRTLLSLAIRRLDRRGVDAVTATGLCTAYHAELAHLGFARETGTFKIGTRLDRAAHPTSSLTRENAWYLSAGDGEQLYALLA